MNSNLNEELMYRTNNNFDFKKIENGLLKTVYREGPATEKNSLPPLALNLQMDTGYYSVIDKTSESQFQQWKLKNELDRNKKALELGNLVYIPMAKIDIKVKTDYQMMINLINRASWRKTNLTVADVSELASNFTDICARQLGIGISVANTDYTIKGCQDGKTYANEDWDIVVGLFTTFYFIIINYIMKNRCSVGQEVKILRNNLSLMTLNYGMTSIIPMHLKAQADKYRRVFCKIVDVILNEILYPYIDVEVSRVSGISVDSSEMNYISLYNKVKIILDNICGNFNETYYYFALKDIIGFVLYDEDVWKVLINNSVKDNYYIKYSNSFLNTETTSAADKFLINLIGTTSEYVIEAKKRKNEIANKIKESISGISLEDASYKEYEYTKSIHKLFYQLMQYIRDNTNKRSDGVEYREYKEKAAESLITKLFVRNEQSLAMNQSYYQAIYTGVVALYQKGLPMQVNQEIVDLSKDVGLVEPYNLDKYTYEYNGYKKFKVDFYFDKNNASAGTYIRYIEMAYEEPVIVDVEVLDKYKDNETSKLAKEIKEMEESIGWTL